MATEKAAEQLNVAMPVSICIYIAIYGMLYKYTRCSKQIWQNRELNVAPDLLQEHFLIVRKQSPRRIHFWDQAKIENAVSEIELTYKYNTYCMQYNCPCKSTPSWN